MKIFVKVKPSSKEEKIEKIDDINFKVQVKEPPEKGKANKTVVRVIAEYFKVAPSRVSLISGFSSRQKIFEINKN